MDDALRNHLLKNFDATPADVASFRRIIRSLVSHLPHLDPLEAEIMQWDANGRDPSSFERLRKLAWNFDQVGQAASRNRLFAGFVTNLDDTDGFAADFLIDIALAAGIPEATVREVMTAH